MADKEICHYCGGTGHIMAADTLTIACYEERCPRCGGAGVIFGGIYEIIFLIK